jgi:protein-disulfide isomerase
VPAERLTRKQRRDVAREAARLEREKQKKRDALRRTLARGGVTLAILGVLGVVALVIVTAVQPPGPGPANMLSDGIVLTSTDGTVITAVKTDALLADAEPVATDQETLGTDINIVIYVDYFCPLCKLFEDTNGNQIQTLVEEGTASLEVHPISILDNASEGTRYSSRAANAAACVANSNPGSFFHANSLLFTRQPAEGLVSLTDDELIGIFISAGVLTDKLSACIKAETFKSWVTEATARALAGPLPNSNVENVKGTPTIIVNGVKYEGRLDDPLAFGDFVIDQLPD